ncbi:hypothetical protein K440DRAFT_331006 [Wilcoxina mikolae CBS 423.85]|nr:hypothetical protein K440DRAFT_331006 [Wilcoxina mikolae CBS 423.85]
MRLIVAIIFSARMDGVIACFFWSRRGGKMREAMSPRTHPLSRRARLSPIWGVDAHMDSVESCVAVAGELPSWQQQQRMNFCCLALLTLSPSVARSASFAVRRPRSRQVGVTKGPA